MEASLNALPTIGGVGGNVTVNLAFFGGGPGGALYSSYLMTFGGTLAGGTNVPLLTLNGIGVFWSTFVGSLLDGGTNAAVTTDQRGFARPVDVTGIPNATVGRDIGAYEAAGNELRVSATRAGSLLVFPYYTSTISNTAGGGNPFTGFSTATLEAQASSDTRITISNISNAASTVANQAYVHLFLIDGATCQQADFFLCLTPNASFSFKASEYDPGNTGYVIAIAVNA